MDPVIDFGLDVRLTLCALGQLASPVQALWIFGSLASHLDNRQFGQVLFSPEAQIQAFRSWILMRCRQVWQPEVEPVVNAKTVSLMGFWNEFASLSLPELMYLQKWDELQGCSLSLAAILDAIIRDQQCQIPKSPGFREDIMEGQVEDPIQNDDAITPWFDSPEITSPMKVECQPDICQAFFPDCDQVPVRCAISQGSQVGQLIAAQEKLVGSIGPVTVVSAIGTDLAHSHELDLGSTFMVRAQAQSGSESSDVHVGLDPKCHAPVVMPCASGPMPLAGQSFKAEGCWECGPLPKLPVQGPFAAFQQEIAHPTPSILNDFPMPEVADIRVETQCEARVKGHDTVGFVDPQCKPTLIEPTATWSQPIIDPNPAPASIALPALTEPIRSAGVSEVPDCPASIGVGAAHSCISAAPLMALQSEQFVDLTPPCINCFDHLDALRNQVVLAADRVEILNKQGDTWADDEIRFHLLCLQQKVATSPAPLKPGVAVPLMIDPLLCASWMRNQGSMCVQWCLSHPEVAAAGVQVIACFRVGTHWIPVWFVPMKDHVHITTWDAKANSHADLEPLLERMGYAFGFRSVMINRQQRIFFNSCLCGSLAIAFLHHALFDSMLPTNHDEAAFLQARLKRQFFDHVQSQQATVRPWVWGNGDDEESDQVSETASPEAAESAGGTSLCPVASGEPCGETSLQVDLSRYEIDFPPTCIGLGREGGFAHRCITAEERIQLIVSKGQAMADDEIRFHAIEFLQGDSVAVGMNDVGASGFAFLDPLLFSTWDSVGKNMCIHWCQHHPQIKEANHQIVSAINFDEHWMPVWITARSDVLQMHVVDNFHGMFPLLEDIGNTLAVHLGFSEVVYHWIPVGFPQDEMCGALTIAFLGHIIAKEPLPQTQRELQDLHVNLRAAFVEAVYTSACCRCPVVWGRGPGPQCRELASELLKHGVPETEAENRAAQAIRAIGSDQVQQALKHKQPWRQLKSLANNVRFQFLHPAELAEVVAANRGKQVGKKTKGNSNVRISRMPTAVDLDPQKIKLMEGIFRADQRVVPQILPQQIGPVASGVVLMTLADAEPYLRAGAQVSQEPLALAICQAPDVVIETTLPHKSVTIPCRCLADNEPILVETVLVQLGSGFVDKVSGQTKVELESLDVVTIKMISFKDELPIDWESFSAAPIKHLVSQFPILRRCETQGCQCNHWHNSDNLPIRDPILDVWRRQFLRNGFKPVPASQADFFSVCIRVPRVLMQPLLEASGASGTYCEPRTADGKEILEEFSVIWTPRQSVSELHHLKQTNPAVVGLARMGDRRGLRVLAAQAQTVHGVLRPDAMFLPQGPRCEFLAGPFPYGIDRHAICKALKQAGWSTKPLQPAAPVPGKGNMWLIHAVEEPPETIIVTSHGEVVISRHRQDAAPKQSVPRTVGSAATLSLCGSTRDDPWTKSANDPWGQYKPSVPAAGPSAQPPTESLQQLEDRIQSAVLTKLGASMDVEVPERMAALESTVQGLLHKQGALETQFGEYTAASTQQLNAMQTQINTQAQQLHGQLENQNQSIQAMFNDQMQQIRGLLSKRPRDDTME